MSAKRKLDDHVDGGNGLGQGQRKNQKRGGVLRPGMGGLPAKPMFSNTATNNNNTRKNSNEESVKLDINNLNSTINRESSSVELFPGMLVNLPNEASSTTLMPSGNKNSNSNIDTNSNEIQNQQPTAEAFQLFSSILGNLQTSQQQQQQQQQQYQYPQYQQQYNHQYQQQFHQPYNQQYNQNYNMQYNQPYQQTFDQQQYNQQYQQYTTTYQPNIQQTQTYDIQNTNTNRSTNNTLFTLFNKLLETQSNINNSNTQNKHSLSKSEGETNQQNQNKQQITSKQQKTNNKNSNKNGNKNKLIVKKEAESESEKEFTDDEANWDKSIAIQGTNIVFENDEDIEKWIAERKKNWPTNKRVEEKQKEIEKAKKIMDNLNNNSNSVNESTNSKIKVCSFWLKTKKCKNGKNCKFSHDVSNIQYKRNGNNVNKKNGLLTKALPNHKLKIVHGIPVQIPQRFTPLQNKGKSLHNLMVEGEQFKKENMELLDIFEKLVKSGIITQSWDELKKNLRLDDESLKLN